MREPFTLLTIVHGREQALRNQLLAVAMNTVLPTEVIIVHMNEPIKELPNLPYTVRQLCQQSDLGLNLAAARNYAMRHSHTERNIFLDVDCIPSATLFEEYMVAFAGEDYLVSGRVRYLSREQTSSLDLSGNLIENSQPDPVRSRFDQFTHELFWTLNFGCTKQTFTKIGGFDERFSGYGAEDTDFAFAAREQGIDILTINATAFHQYHPSYAPPLNHIVDILHNADYFYNKWGKWPMEGWLKAFEERGYIAWTAAEIELLRQPTPEEIASTLKE
ncbi:galactosyltransferase-related protein [Sphingobacterium griseoflavum]|uniref:Glycosyl transferase family A n=1 Tax=Sphingobacterium griseoflavum TaxID=1474952 RepID=A0ABQ3HWY5_9SPHI|nr:galactosyltransferase-related protein [Sphingobacterium griseoflavum]GHE35900.1 glycosyl transferase family A [Sphingobacterium griseoflavum]